MFKTTTTIDQDTGTQVAPEPRDVYRQVQGEFYEDKLAAVTGTHVRAARDAFAKASRSIIAHIDALSHVCPDGSFDKESYFVEAQAAFGLIENWQGSDSIEPGASTDAILASNAIVLTQAAQVLREGLELLQGDLKELEEDAAVLSSARAELTSASEELRTKEDKIERIQAKYAEVEENLVSQGRDPSKSKKLQKFSADIVKAEARKVKLVENQSEKQAKCDSLTLELHDRIDKSAVLLSGLCTDTLKSCMSVKINDVDTWLEERDREVEQLLTSDAVSKQIDKQHFAKMKPQLIDKEVQLVLKGAHKASLNHMAISLLIYKMPLTCIDDMALKDSPIPHPGARKMIMRPLRRRINVRHSFGRGKPMYALSAEECRKDAEVALGAVKKLLKTPELITEEGFKRGRILVGIIYLKEKARLLNKIARKKS